MKMPEVEKKTQQDICESFTVDSLPQCYSHTQSSHLFVSGSHCYVDFSHKEVCAKILQAASS